MWKSLGRQEPIRADIYGPDRLEQEAERLAASHETVSRRTRRHLLRRRLEESDRELRAIHESIVTGARRGEPISPAAEWFLDNFHLVLDQIREVRQDFPRTYEKQLPQLAEGEWRGFPRVYAIAIDVIAHTDSNPDMETLRRFLTAYQRVTTLSIGELWAVPIAFRMALIENLRRLAGRMEVARRERAKADALCDRILSAIDGAAEGEREKTAEAVLRTPERREIVVNPTFAVRVMQRLRDIDPALSAAQHWIEEELAREGLTTDAAVHAEHHRQTTAQATIANIIASMRLFSQTDWSDFFESVSLVEKILSEDPAGAYRQQDFATRDRYRHVVETLGRRDGEREKAVARRAVDLAAAALADPERHVGWYLIDRGRGALERAAGWRPPLPEAARRAVLRRPTPVYLGSIAALAALGEALVARYAARSGASPGLVAAAALLALVPVSELAMTLVNFTATRLLPPHLLPKLLWRDGIPPEFETLVAVPALIEDEEGIRELLTALQIRSYANPDPRLRFALLTDFVDAGEETISGEEALVPLLVEGIRQLNESSETRPPDGGDRFWLFHRRRLWNPAERKWMGWERKRGKLTELNRALRGKGPTTFEILPDDREALRRIRFVLTLDADTRLPRDSATALAGTLAHPLNRPRLDTETGVVREGHGIVQPRVSITPESANRSAFAQISSGHAGIDPYTTAVSNVYQDLFDEGSFTGKAIYDVDAFEAALAGRVPENALLSHDLFEGSFARSALATDIEVFEDHPSSYDVYTRRQHRWIRGDWQLLRWLAFRVPGERGRVRNDLSALSLWKIFDNLRRSLVPPALLLWLAAAWLVLPGSPFVWSALAVLTIAFPIVFHLAEGLSIHPRGVPWTSHFWSVWGDAMDNCAQFALRVAFLPHLAVVSLDAAVRATWRQFVSHRGLLDWTTAAASERSRAESLPAYFRRMGAGWTLAVALAAATAWFAPGSLVAASPFLLLWFVAPALAAQLSRPIPETRSEIPAAERRELREIARQTWRYFDRFCGAAENGLPPDNYQEDRDPALAHRTSPTNVGLSLLAVLAAHDFGYLGTGDAIDRLERTLDSLERLPRHRGHFYNWYDILTLAPLHPLYVSSVDSGNLAACLVALEEGAKALAASNSPDGAWRDGLADVARLVAKEFERVPPSGVRTEAVPVHQVREQIRALSETASAEHDKETCLREVAQLASEIADGLSALAAEHRELEIGDLRGWLDDLLAQVRSHARELPGDSAPALAAVSPGATSEIPPASAPSAERLHAIARRAESLVREMDFRFLFDPERKVFSIGLNPALGRLDRSYYDLLVSEARLTSFVAIAKGDAPTEHWFRLQRPFTVAAGKPLLLSWSGSMFEYLMPLLLLRSYPGTLLASTCRNAVAAQMQFGRARGVPWGVSESAYNARDLHLNYQYGPFGVPELGLRRVAPDEVVVSPYSTFLALLADPTGAVDNLRRLAAEGARGPFGFWESVDYTERRLPPDARSAVIKASMAHHQGMILIALDNYLNRDAMRERFHADPAVQATELLLQERIPRNTAALAGSIVAQVAAGRVVREEATIPMRRFETPDTPTPRTQILSNGSYTLLMTAAGAGESRRGNLAVTRWRDDSTTDSWGSWIYLRDVRSGVNWSAGYQPTVRPPKRFEARFSEHKVEISRSDEGVDTTMEVIVSSQDDAEIRRVTLANNSPRARDARDIEVTSYAEIVLGSRGADVSHPAFSKLFVETEWIGNALLARRRPRSAEEAPVWAVHVLAVRGATLGAVQYETDRARFLGRGRSPRAPAVLVEDRPLSNTTGAVLDPIFSLRQRVRIAQGETARLLFSTGVADTREAAIALAERLQDPRLFDREASLAWMRSQVLLRHLDITSDEAQLFQRLATRIVYDDPSLRPPPELLTRNRGSQRNLWGHGISGDLPIVLLRIGSPEEAELARQMIRAHEYWRLKGLSVDLVIVNDDPSGYFQPVQEQIQRLIGASPSQALVDKPAGVFVRRGDQISEEDAILLQTAARAVLVGERGTLAEQIERPPALEAWPAALTPATAPVSRPAVPGPEPRRLLFGNGIGGFTPDGREYVVTLAERQYTPAPWVNVIANDRFGVLVSESGSACTWSENSQENRLTPWSNDPVSDPSGEAIYLRDDETAELWSPTALPIRGPEPCVCRHGQGYTVFEHRRGTIAAEVTTFVPEDASVKITRLRLTNRGTSPRRITAAHYVEWVLGVERTTARFVITEREPASGAILARNPYNADFGSRIAFSAVRSPGARFASTADRREFLGRNGHVSDPAGLRRTTLLGRVGAGLDPCAAHVASFSLAAGETRDIVILLGQGSDRAEAAELIGRFGEAEAAERALEAVRRSWDRILGGIDVKTPDPALDLLVNRWLPYQAISCRIRGRTAFYQSSGAFGFRDQLQDALGVAALAPEIARRLIPRFASRQFVDGDVQHWWHPPSGRGVRTRCSDDYLWLPYVVAGYVETTGDEAVLDETVPYIEGAPLADHEVESYQEPKVSDIRESVYDHCLRALDRSTAVGPHRLPLIGSGDWNDGFNRVGVEGKGESVWLGWFLHATLTRFAAIAERHGDAAHADRFRRRAAALKSAIEDHAWDGDWYVRAFYDDGSPLGSARDAECRIDSLAQTWAALSGAGDRVRVERAMIAVEQYLVRREDGLVLLFTPPFNATPKDPGYIKGYLPGIRENGGQYTHAAAWAIMAFAELGNGDLAAELLALVNPIAPTSTRAGLHRYKVEPYVTAGDVYSVEPLTGRGGWTWYTGSAGWLYRAATESILGLRLEGSRFRVDPCMPRRWPGFEIRYRDAGETLYAITVQNPRGVCRGVREVVVDGTAAADGSIPRHRDGKRHDVRVVLGE
jgi:cellobiose phosphorylase